MWGERLRGMFAVGLVSAAIIAAFIVIDTGDDDSAEQAPETSITTTTVAPTTTRPRSDDDQLCDLADEYSNTTAGLDTGNTDLPGIETTEPDSSESEEDGSNAGIDGVVIDALERFYDAAAELDLGEVTPEFDAAAQHYALYNRIGSPFGFDSEEILRDGTENDRWIGLVTVSALGVDDSRTYVLAVCNVSLPEAPSEDPEDIEDLVDEILDDQEDDG